MSSEVVTTQEKNNKLYMLNSKTNIDNFIHNNEYKKAFELLISVLERLDNNQKVEFINYYSEHMSKLGFFNNSFPSTLSVKKC